ncbi:MAG: hypothetical protein JHC93_03550 [Parachlamydiales bacterium]|nr:hypothetical protein [Parachlamydiales bacterium]
MRKLFFASLLALSSLTSAVHADFFTLVPFQQYAESRSQVFAFFDQLKSYGAYVVGDDGQYLGEVSRSRFGTKSLNNDWTYGNTYKNDCIFNSSGLYGSCFSNFSAFNTYAVNPPTIRYKQNGVEFVAAYLTMNSSFLGSYQVPNINPCCLCDWLKAMDCCH